jgi:hypothetical protein
MSNEVSRYRDVPGTVERLRFEAPLKSEGPLELDFPTSDYRVFEESYTPNSSGDRKSWKEFQHRKAWRAPVQAVQSGLVRCEQIDFYPGFHQVYPTSPRFAVGGYTNEGNFVPPFGEPGLPLSGLPKFYDEEGLDGFVPKPDQLGELNSKALKVMLPRIKAELSLVNSLIELKDFKTLPHSYSTFKKAVSNVTALFTESRRRYASLRTILKGPADGWLQSKFNVLPLLSDITGVRTALSQLERRLNDLVTRSGRVQRRHFTFSWDEFGGVKEWEISPAYWPVRIQDGCHNQVVQYYLRRLPVYDPSVYHAQIEYNYNFTQYQLEHARVLALLDYLGVNFDPSIIWNAIPWSFVVDWVLSVGRYLENFKVLNMAPKINILRYMWSVKRRRTVFFLNKRDFPSLSFTVSSSIGKPLYLFRSLRRLLIADPSTTSRKPHNVEWAEPN